MKSALLAALLLSAAALATRESSTATTAGDEREPDQEDEGDSAPFMIVVEHTNGKRCGGSLVSLRTALTSAWCVSGEGGDEPRELWALAPGAGAVRRVARVALAAGAAATRGRDAWSGAAMDLAVLELEAPFGSGARSRPILMATQTAECAPPAACHVVRALGRGPLLRIVDATLVPGEACAQRSRGWPVLRDSALCLVGPTLCANDWGAGVVCEGELCGVLSRSARAADASTQASDANGTSEMRDETCGDTHVAQSVARWRRFLHCAHTLRACGRGGDCAQLCSERRLLETDATDKPGTVQPEPTETITTETVETNADTEMSYYHTPTLTTDIRSSLHTLRPARPTPPTRSTTSERSTFPAHDPSPQSSPRPAFEFEPNRPDFKAGEYGDNGAEYGGEEPLLPPAVSPEVRSSSAPPSDATRGRVRPADMQARVSPAAIATPRSGAAGSPARISASLLFILVAITNFTN